ncbi:MAG: glycosyltransferase family 4 protein [Anaerolineales bacterium]|nr:glycosyltransferase family 4 protein [Anaerolineales bacterium]MCZ2288715.1 glycosyltransferase family 4 protein [Anaerolineales bacterium]
MGNKIRLAMVEPNGAGGLIHYAYQLCAALSNAELDVTLVTGTNYEMAEFPHNFRVQNILALWTLFDPQQMHEPPKNPLTRLWHKIHRTLRRGVRAVRLIRAWMGLTRHLTNLKPDIVLFSKINFPFETYFLGLMQRRGLLLAEIGHEFELRESSGRFAALVARAYAGIYTHFSAIFFHAQENRERFLSLFPFVPRERTHVIAHGNSDWLLSFPARDKSELLAQYGLRGDERVVLFFGLLAPSKGLDDLIDAFALARQSCAAKLVIAGYPTKHIHMDELRKRIHERGVSDDVILDTRYIPLSDIRPLMEIAALVVYPYRSSTQSGSLQMAYTFSKPVIATNVGGLPEAVEDGLNGFLVPPQTPSALAEKIAALVNDPALAEEMGRQSRRLAETRFGWNTIAARMRPVFEDLLKRDNG